MANKVGFLGESLSTNRADSVRALAAGELVISKLRLGELSRAVRTWLSLAVVDQMNVVVLLQDSSIALGASYVLRLGPAFSTFF